MNDAETNKLMLLVTEYETKTIKLKDEKTELMAKIKEELIMLEDGEVILNNWSYDVATDKKALKGAIEGLRFALARLEESTK